MKTEGIYLSWIIVKNLDEAIRFYTETVGLTLKERAENYGWAELAGPEGAILGLAQECPEHKQSAGSNAVVTISVDDIQKACEQFVKKGATLVDGIIEVPGHVKMQTFQDGDGNTLQLVQKLW
jgi:predicted enzyme related to lactoylglutathione lyase